MVQLLDAQGWSWGQSVSVFTFTDVGTTCSKIEWRHLFTREAVETIVCCGSTWYLSPLKTYDVIFGHFVPAHVRIAFLPTQCSFSPMIIAG